MSFVRTHIPAGVDYISGVIDRFRRVKIYILAFAVYVVSFGDYLLPVGVNIPGVRDDISVAGDGIL